MKTRTFKMFTENGEHWYDFVVKTDKIITYELKYSNDSDWAEKLKGSLILKATESKGRFEDTFKIEKIKSKMDCCDFSELRLFLNAINHLTTVDNGYEMVETTNVIKL